MPIVLRFDDKSALDAAHSGGKGANLAKLTQLGLPVPGGFVLAAQAYERFIAAAAPLFANLGQLKLGDPAELEGECAALIAELARLPFPPEVRAALDEQLAAYPADAAFSVRSSATTEDLGGAAFAGQHETYLNCIGADDIADKVKKCWLSLWSGRAVAYRTSAGFDVGTTSMAVVIQRMAFCDVAGVGFSINPVSGCLTEQVFDANFGLGESVVGGEALVDHFTVAKATSLVTSQQIAEKEFMIVADAAGTGTREIRLGAEKKTTPCLNDAQIKALSSMLTRVEQAYGYPQDIEWGFEGGHICLLQSRPITRIPPRWTRDESAERFPSVITPLAWALVEEGFHRSLNFSFDMMGLPPYRDKWFAMFGHYIYGNQNAVEVYANGAATGIRISTLAELIAAIPLLKEQYAWVLELPLTWSRDLDHYLMTLGELMAEPLDHKSTAQLWDYVLRVKELGADYFLPNIAISITQRTLYRILHAILQLAVGKDQAPAMFDRLLAYCETKTGVVNKELYRLASRISAIAPLAAKLRNSSARDFLDQGGFAGHADLAAAFAKFLRDHGHREVEFDPYHPTWLEAPWLVVENLKVMLDSHLEDPADKERELKFAMRETEAALVAGLPQEIRFFVHEIIRLARSYTSLDDIEHYQTTRLTLPFRRGLRALGARLAAAGVIAEPMDVFFAPYDALDAAVKADDPRQWWALAELVANGKKDYLRHRDETPVWELGKESAPAAIDADSLNGLPGSPGVARGPVFKVHGSEDFAKFPKGAVLVARTTNPAWTPLFYKAAAVVTESGGPLSHGAVTAREIGLPAVMSVRGVLAALHDGQMITVDGSAGRVSAQGPKD
jgi:phosphoenolpyruvate synthase/pyruvate phosphate dikinase